MAVTLVPSSPGEVRPRDAPAGTVLNVNVPDLPFHQVRGVREAALARFGTVEATMLSDDDQPLHVRLGARGGASDDDENGGR